MELLVGKPCSMHLAAPGAVAYLYHIQHVLSQEGKDMSWNPLEFHQEIGYWRALASHMEAFTTHLVDIIYQELTHLGFCKDSGIFAGGAWIEPSRYSTRIVWRYSWPSYIIADLVLESNPGGMLTNSNLEIATLVLHEDTQLAAFPEATMAAPHSGLDNTSEISWRTHEMSTINPVVADLLRIRALHSRQFYLIP